MEQVTSYLTIDKKLFTDKAKAERHERIIKFTNKLKGSSKKTKGEINTLIHFIDDNQEAVLELLDANKGVRIQ
ncbi:MAG: hypothetical protein GY951_13190 [Psychromonas sp.]|nr:hypothetical protein [Psychromonas sp.]